MKTIFFLLILLINTAKANSYNDSFNNLTITKKEIINKVNNYLNTLQTIKTNFLQYDENSETMSEGILYISKPEKN